jgi:hypothetical protein
VSDVVHLVEKALKQIYAPLVDMVHRWLKGKMIMDEKEMNDTMHVPVVEVDVELENHGP